MGDEDGCMEEVKTMEDRMAGERPPLGWVYGVGVVMLSVLRV